MTDYTAPSPLWSDEGGVGLDDARLSPALAARLRAWNELFQDHHRSHGGWQDAAAREQFAASAPALLRDLRTELHPTVVVLHDWTGTVPPEVS